jgi:predicted acylesterase/phospholipase RssA
MCGLYQIGVLKELRKRELAGEFYVEAMSGASIGSYLAFCYYNDSLDLAAETLAEAKRTFKESPGAPYAGAGFCDAITKQITECDDAVFELIKHGCIYSSRTDIGTITNKIDSNYETREDLADAIICSMHVPYVTGRVALYFERWTAVR